MVGIQHGKGKEQGQVKEGVVRGADYEAADYCCDYAYKVVQIELEAAPCVFQAAAYHVVKVETEYYPDYA